MRVLHLGAGNLYGGIESMLVTLARCRHLCPQMMPEFGLAFAGRVSEELAALGVPVHLFGAVQASRPWTVWQARERLTRLLQREQFDLAVVHASWPHGVFAPAIRRARVPLACWLHAPAPKRHWIERWAARTRPDFVIANSSYTAAGSDRLFPGVPSAVVHCPVDRPAVSAVRSATRRSLGIADTDVVLVQISRLEECKGHRVLLEALGALRTVPGWTMLVAGGAQQDAERRYLQQLQALAAEKDIATRVHFLGQRRDVGELLAASDVFCQPNTGPDSFGLSFVEALWAGLPVVTTNLGGAREIVTPACGVLVEPKDPAALAAALRQLVADGQQRALLARGTMARAASLCAPEQQLPRLYTLLTAVAGRQGTVARQAAC